MYDGQKWFQQEGNTTLHVRCDKLNITTWLFLEQNKQKKNGWKLNLLC